MKAFIDGMVFDGTVKEIVELIEYLDSKPHVRFIPHSIDGVEKTLFKSEGGDQ